MKHFCPRAKCACEQNASLKIYDATVCTVLEDTKTFVIIRFIYQQQAKLDGSSDLLKSSKPSHCTRHFVASNLSLVRDTVLDTVVQCILQRKLNIHTRLTLYSIKGGC